MPTSSSSPTRGRPTRRARRRSRKRSWRSWAAPRRCRRQGSDAIMTATIETPAADAQGGKAVGRVVRVIGPVVDVEFAPDEMPDIFNALQVERTLGGETRTLTLEVAQHIGDNQVRAISLQPTDGV